MKNIKSLLIVTIVSLGLMSCGKSLCVRCESGLFGDTDTECFTNLDERDNFVNSREALGYSCTGD